MSRPTDQEIAPYYQALDSDAAEDLGAFRDAHKLGVISRSSNRLVTRGHTLFNLSWDTLDESHEFHTPAPILPGWVRWNPVLRGPLFRPKKPGLNKLDLIIRATLPEDDLIMVQCSTLRSPFRPGVSPDDPLVLRMVGTGSEAKYVLRGIPVDRGAFERVQLYQLGQIRPVLGDEGAHTVSGGGSNQGVVGAWYDDGLFEGPIVGSDWNAEADGSTWAPDHALVVYDTALAPGGAFVYTGSISMVRNFYQLYADPIPSASFRRSVRGKNFAIFELPMIRYHAACGFLQDLEPGEV